MLQLRVLALQEMQNPKYDPERKILSSLYIAPVARGGRDPDPNLNYLLMRHPST